MSDPIEEAILDLCSTRGVGRTICPSEVARYLATNETEWRTLMPEVRRTAAQLQAQGRLHVTQRRKPVDPVSARGPIRLGLVQSGLTGRARRHRSEQ